jgi:peptide/nickel transport system substrate-binding protein
MRCFGIVVVLAMLGILMVASASAAPEGQLTWAVHVSLAPTWFDPAETPGIITPYMVLYAIHDALVKPMPGEPMAASLAESWTASADGKTYDFVLRKGATFHNGEPVTAEDVKFSFERYRGSASKTLKDRVAGVDALDARHVRFRLKDPWPDFLLFYASTSGAGWIVPKKYVEKVGDEAFKSAPVGAGPYKFVSFTPGGGARDGSVRPVLAQDAERQAARVPVDSRRGDAARRAQARRSGPRVFDPR